MKSDKSMKIIPEKRTAKRRDFFPNIKVEGELTWTEYCTLYRYSLYCNLPSMFDGIRQLIREEASRELDEDRDN